MSNKKIIKSLDKLTQTKLPESLKKENIIEMLGDIEQNEEDKTAHVKRSYAKRLIPIAASLALVLGLTGLYFNANRKGINAQNASNKTAEVIRYDDYSEIYAKFDKLKSDYDKKKWKNDLFGEWNNFAVVESSDDSELTGSSDKITSYNGGVTGTAQSGETDSDTAASEKTNLRDETEEIKFGETNTQENGVDEGDIIKTDGKYIYAVNTADNTFSVVDCTGEKMKSVSKLELTDKMRIADMFINGDKAVLVGYKLVTDSDGTAAGDSDTEVYNSFYSSCGDLSDTAVYVYDISDKTAPKEDVNYFQQGGYYSSRMIGSKLYCVSTYYVDLGTKDIRDGCIPEIEVNGQNGKVPAGCISVINETKSPSYAVITVLDTDGAKEPTVEAVLGSCDELYAAAENLFICETEYGANEVTKIYKFDYTETGVDYKCYGQVSGYLNNQFSMSLYNGYLRVATTLDITEEGTDGEIAWSSANGTTNTLYILDGDMQTVGKAENLANGELIKSARFVGNTAYIVTFVQTDPLFVIDVSNPTAPQVKSELKLPGFSQYLHPIADGFLVGVGQDGTETGVNNDCKVSLFDVSDPSAPAEVSKLKVMNGQGYVYNDLQYNHKLFISLPDGEFAVPFFINNFYWNNDGIYDVGVYIRYKIKDGELREAARYNLGYNTSAMGATYIGDTFYVVVNNYGDTSHGTSLAAYSLETNEELDRINI